ncbi:hypothetical protein [Thermus sp.]|uniref:hypothetical protein n=1 Tax=Thermus sp. TaxID=275 RepID=UPI00307DCD50
MRKLLAAALLLAGLGVAQGTSPDYRQAALSAALLARLQTVAQGAQGEEKLLTWAKTLKDRAERDYAQGAHFKAAREAQAALHLFRAASAPTQPPKVGMGRGRLGMGRWDHRGMGFKGGQFRMGLPPQAPVPGVRGGYGAPAQALVDRAEKELGYYRGQDPLVKDLIAEAKARQEKEPPKAALLARAALALISAERGF